MPSKGPQVLWGGIYASPLPPPRFRPGPPLAVVPRYLACQNLVKPMKNQRFHYHAVQGATIPANSVPRSSPGVPRLSQEVPRPPQEVPRRPQDCPNRPQDDHKRTQVHPKSPQDHPKKLPRGSSATLRSPKMFQNLPRGFKLGVRGAQEAPRQPRSQHPKRHLRSLRSIQNRTEQKRTEHRQTDRQTSRQTKGNPT